MDIKYNEIKPKYYTNTYKWRTSWMAAVAAFVVVAGYTAVVLYHGWRGISSAETLSAPARSHEFGYRMIDEVSRPIKVRVHKTPKLEDMMCNLEDMGLEDY